MGVPYDSFIGAFLSKITDYDLADIDRRYEITVDLMKRTLSLSTFKKVCGYDFTTTADDYSEQFDVDIDDEILDEIVDIVSEGMVVQWLKPYVYKQELLENVMNTRDYTMYSPAELLLRVGNAYSKAQKDYIQMIREYSYNHGDLTDLHI